MGILELLVFELGEATRHNRLGRKKSERLIKILFERLEKLEDWVMRLDSELAALIHDKRNLRDLADTIYAIKRREYTGESIQDIMQQIKEN